MAYSIVFVPLMLLAILLCIALPLFLGVFVYQDAKARGMEPLVWALIAVLAPSFIGLIIYLVVRRDHVLLNCPTCGGPVQESYTSCPQCGQKLRANCRNCGAALRPEWKLCPQCGTEIGETEPFVSPVVSQGAGSKKLMIIVAAILLVPVILVAVAVAGMVGLTSYTTMTTDVHQTVGVSDGDLAVRKFEALSGYSEKCGVFTIEDAQLSKEATDWIAAAQKNERAGLYAKTFYEYDGGELISKHDEGSGTYNITYACVVTVINPKADEQYALTGCRMDPDYDNDPIISEEISVELTELSAVPKEEKKSAKASAKQFGNVFVIRFPITYEVDFDFKDGSSVGQFDDMDSTSIDVIVKGKDSSVTSSVPIDPDLDGYFDFI